jgi:hypothetical protein
MANPNPTYVYKAQWPLSTTESNPMILIYPDATRKPWYYLPATLKNRKRLFKNKYIKVYFRGRVDNQTIEIDEFVRKGE